MVTVLQRLRHDVARGALLLDGTRYLVIRPETVIAFQKRVEAALGPGRAGDLVADGGAEGGRLSTHKFLAAGFDAPAAAQAMAAMGPEIGWGAFHLGTVDVEARRIDLTVEASPFAEAYGASDVGPVCHLIRGVLLGIAEACFSESGALRAQEVACVSTGASNCRFVVAPRAALAV